MRPCPSIIDGARVICYTPIDRKHKKTGQTIHRSGEREIEDAKGLAICQYDGDGAYYLFGCDENWECQSDTCHQTLLDAKEQAEFEYVGTAHSWVPAQ